MSVGPVAVSPLGVTMVHGEPCGRRHGTRVVMGLITTVLLSLVLFVRRGGGKSNHRDQA